MEFYWCWFFFSFSFCFCFFFYFVFFRPTTGITQIRIAIATTTWPLHPRKESKVPICFVPNTALALNVYWLIVTSPLLANTPWPVIVIAAVKHRVTVIVKCVNRCWVRLWKIQMVYRWVWHIRIAKYFFGFLELLEFGVEKQTPDKLWINWNDIKI